jgi:hypothetical protein
MATKAMAAKLARLLYRRLRYGLKYVDQGAEFYEAQHGKQQVIHLKRKAAQLGLEIIEVAAAGLKPRLGVSHWSSWRGVPGERDFSPIDTQCVVVAKNAFTPVLQISEV